MNQRHERPRRADWARAVEVFASGGAYGSGYRVTTSTVITCSHVVAESLSGVKIRDTLQHVGRAEVVWYSNELDIALLTVDFNHSDAAFIVPLPAATVGWFPHSGEGIVRFEMFGWPRADATRDADGNWIRDPVLVDGSIKIAEVAASRTGLVRLRPDDVFPSVRDGSWWEGMSGAAVFCSDMIVAVQVEQPRAEITNYLDASSIGAPSVDSAAEQLKPLVIRLAAEGVKFRPLLEQRIVAVRHAAERQLEAVTVPPPWFPLRLRDSPDIVECLTRRRELRNVASSAKSSINLRTLPPDARVVVIEGSPGAGKTWELAADARVTARSCLAALASGTVEKLELPVLFRLADLNDAATNLDDVLTALLDPLVYQAARGDSAPYPTAGNATVRVRLFIDGVDEASYVQKRLLGRIIDDVLNSGHCEVSAVIVATRPGQLVLPAHPALVGVKLDELSAQDQFAFIDAWFEGLISSGGDEARALSGNWQIADAFRNPLLLTLTCIALEDVTSNHRTLASAADIFRQAVVTLIDSAHRAPSLTVVKSLTSRRESEKVFRVICDLANRSLAMNLFAPTIAKELYADLDAATVDSCCATGLFTLRADDGLDVANRSFACYLAAQHAAMTNTWAALLDRVWESVDMAEAASFVPYALALPLSGTTTLDQVSACLAHAEQMLEKGDPGFTLLHALCRALTFLPHMKLGEIRARLTQVIRAHVLSNVDVHAADSLANLAPSVLADLVQHSLTVSAQSDDHDDDQLWETIWLAIVLANVGYPDGFKLLGDALPRLSDSTFAAGVIEWLARMGNSRGVALLRRIAREGLPIQRAIAALFIALRDGDKAHELLASVLLECSVDQTEYRLEIAGLLHELGDERGTNILRAIVSGEVSWSLFHAITWLGPEEAERYRPKLEGIISGDRSDDYIRITAAMFLASIDHDGAVEVLDAIVANKREDGVIAAWYLLKLDQSRAVHALLRLGAEGSPEVRFSAALVLAGLDSAASAELLLRIIDEESNDMLIRWSAAKALETLEPADGLRAQERLRSRASQYEAIEIEFDPDGTKVLRGSLGSIAMHYIRLEEFKKSPRDHAWAEAAGLRNLKEVRPEEGVYDDPIDSLFSAQTFDHETGMAAALARRIDLSVERDRRTLSLCIPVCDMLTDREYLAAYARSMAPSDDWIRYLAEWSRGNFSNSILNDPPDDEWVEAFHAAVETQLFSPELISIVWSRREWVSNRCFPMAMRYATAGVLLDFSHALTRPAPRALARALCAGRTELGLSESSTRTCVGRACYEVMSEALAEVHDNEVSEVYERYQDYITQLVCEHDNIE